MSATLTSTPRRTWRGRVVYDRKLHAFSERDIERIVRKYAQQPVLPSDLDYIVQLYESVSDILLQAILDTVHIPAKPAAVRKLLEDFVGMLVGKIGAILHIQIKVESRESEYNWDVRV